MEGGIEPFNIGSIDYAFALGSSNDLFDHGLLTLYLSQIETGKSKGTVDILSAIAKALNVPLDDLYEEQN